LSSTSKTISPGNQTSVALSVTSSSGATAATYTISVTAMNSGATSYSGTGSTFYVISTTPFDFSISIEPTSGSVAQGNSISTNISATTVSGDPETVYFSASGLPSGATHGFSPTDNCIPDSSCSRTMTIYTSASTPTGTYQITICGTNNGGTVTHCFYYYELTVTEVGVGINPPQVTTEPATSITQTSATINGTLNSLGNAASCLVWFEWGTTTSYGNTTPYQTMTATGPFSRPISNLAPDTTYYFEAFAKSGGEPEPLSPTSPPPGVSSIPVPPGF